MSNSPWNHANSGGADDIDFAIKGEDLQFVEIELDPGESAVAEAGAMVWKDATVDMSTVFGDGSGASGSGGGGGFMGALLGAGKRLVTGESLFTTVFTHNGQGKATVAFGAPVPGTILPIKLDSVGGTLICQKDSFLCAAKGVSIGIAFQKRMLTGLFGGEGFIMQKLEGDGWVFVQMGNPRRYRLRRGDDFHRRYGRYPSGQHQIHVVRRRRRVLCAPARTGEGVDTVVTVQPTGRTDAGRIGCARRIEPR
jgi:uncharacterized protein (AIM24 family)